MLSRLVMRCRGLIFAILTSLVMISLTGFTNNGEESSAEEIAAFETQIRDILNALIEKGPTHTLRAKTLPIRTPNDLEGNLEEVIAFIQKFFGDWYSLENNQTAVTDKIFAVKKKVFATLELADQNKIRSLLRQKLIDKSVVNVFSFFSPPDLFRIAFYEQHTAQTLADLLQSVPQGSHYGKVSWDDTMDQYSFSDAGFAKKMADVAIVAFYKSDSFAESLATLDEQTLSNFQKNTQTTDPKTKFETFDLLQGMIANLIENFEKGTSRVLTSQLAHRFLYELFGSNENLDARGDRLQSLRVIKSQLGAEVTIYCVGKLLIGGQSNFNFQLPISARQTNLDELGSANTLTCGNQSYDISLEIERPIRYQKPNVLHFRSLPQETPLEATVSLSLIEEASGPIVHLTRLFLETKGYRLKSKTVVDTLSTLREDFVRSHIFVPAAHSLDVNKFPFGTNESVRFDLEKKIKTPTGRKLVKVKLYLPIKKAGPLVRRGTVVANWLNDRRSNVTYPLFVLNASCSSELNNAAWNSIYDISIRRGIKEGLLNQEDLPNDFIFSVASTRTFDTANAADILQNFYYPIQVIEEFAKGSDSNEIVQGLTHPLQDDLTLKALRGAVRLKQQLQGSLSALKNLKLLQKSSDKMLQIPDKETDVYSSFEPVFNQDEEGVFELGRTKLKLVNQNDPEDTLIF